MQGKIELEGNISLRLADQSDRAFLSNLFHQTRDFIYQYAEGQEDYKRSIVEQQEQLRESGYPLCQTSCRA